MKSRFNKKKYSFTFEIKVDKLRDYIKNTLLILVSDSSDPQPATIQPDTTTNPAGQV